MPDGTASPAVIFAHPRAATHNVGTQLEKAHNKNSDDKGVNTHSRAAAE